MERLINKKYLLIPVLFLLTLIGFSIYRKYSINANGTLATAKIIKAQNCSKGSTCFDYEYIVDGKKYTGSSSIAHPLQCIGCAGKEYIIKYSDSDKAESIFIKLKEDY